jgi:kynurenine 3-monooxygenase
MKCYPWTYEDKVALIGDSVMQSCLYGQGMNAGFEDISVLYEMIEKYGGDWELIFQNIKTHVSQMLMR